LTRHGLLTFGFSTWRQSARLTPFAKTQSPETMARQPDDKPAAKSRNDDSALIRELALLLDETNLTEIEIERAGMRVRVARNISISASVPASVQVAAPAAAAAAPTAGVADVS